jgi:HD-GYP domain-containing protein (c-di-GMP phosphodiesterase class II)
MTERAAMGNITEHEGAREQTDPQRGSSRFSKLTAIIATVALVAVLALGFASSRLLGSDVLDISIGASLAVAYLALVALARRPSSRSRWADAQRRVDEVKSNYDSIVAVLCAALDLRDDVAHGQAKRVSELASVIAWQMGLRKEEVRRIEKAAMLHNIGKIGIADAVLAKPGPLNDAEWAEMKRHPELGHRMLQGIDFLKDAAEIVYTHHERYDGSGYPRGLKEETIPLGARIFAVVDAYDAITSYRPYRKAQPHRKAVEEIVRNSGTQFDPEVVRAFLEAEKQGLLDDGRGRRERGAGASAAGAGVGTPAVAPVSD